MLQKSVCRFSNAMCLSDCSTINTIDALCHDASEEFKNTADAYCNDASIDFQNSTDTPS